ncbi:dephospho-CoA kinase [Thalassorhabdomicrobium marinisediminis]|uniref:Dephospho-CoA kinase n=1 Tax=Thalassorhabdomicrobium marinisediminis TaxID=2170577 RepID=A0A2T7FZS1_9RHOB|nr:dephospho-CoA kinase [Thalassorhabdomicrobium marinisediminis]PVA07655.1 dephospho-CoA kinase [Thalassorhabdomicrobium marinisediminis]
MTFVLGLTGSIGMGKSTTAAMFADEGIPVWDADAAVRRLYAKGGQGAAAIGAAYPEVIEEGAVSRQKLRTLIAASPEVLDHIQTLVHPLVAQDRQAFLKQTPAPIVLLDIPLLYEGGGDAQCDGVAVVSVPEDVQRQRVLARGEMSEADFELIKARQMPDAEKRAKARWVIETLTLDAARQSVREIIAEIEQEQADA